MNLEDLKKEIPYQWKIQSQPKGWKQGLDTDKKASCVAYIDSRDCQDILDKVCGMDKWQSDFYEVKGKVFCKVGIKIENEWVWKSDSGALAESDFVEEETTSKGETSDAFKRACVQWGIGRFLYSKAIVWISYSDYNANKYKLSDFCNGNKKTNIDNAPNPHTNKKAPFTLVEFKQLTQCFIDSGVEVARNWVKEAREKLLFPDYIETKISKLGEYYKANNGVTMEDAEKIWKEFNK